MWDGSTGALINHMRDNHSTEFKKMVERGDIKGTSKRMVVDGNVVERLSFEEASKRKDEVIRKVQFTIPPGSADILGNCQASQTSTTSMKSCACFAVASA